MMRKFFAFLAILVIVGVGLLTSRAHAHGAVLAADTISTQSMTSRINALIGSNPDVDISVSCEDLNTGQSFHYGVSDVFEAASTTKLFTAADFLHDRETGTESLNENLEGENAGYALKIMIVNSDDNAWALLDNELDDDQLNNYIASLGITDFNAADNTLSSNDVVTFLTKLYRGELLNKTDTNLLLGYMKQANYSYLIPQAVPAGATVYHKAGLLEDRVHDSAIITYGGRTYILVIFTNGHGVYDTPERIQLIHNITDITYKHFIG